VREATVRCLGKLVVLHVLCLLTWPWLDPRSRSRSLWSCENCSFLGLSPPPLLHGAQNSWLVVIIWDLFYSLSEPDFRISSNESYHESSNFAECQYLTKFKWPYFGIAWCYSQMVGHASSPTGIVHADVTLTRPLTWSKVNVKVTWLLNFQKLPKPCVLAATTISPLAGLSGSACIYTRILLCCIGLISSVLARLQTWRAIIFSRVCLWVWLPVCLWPALVPFNVNRFWRNLVTRTLLWSSLAATIMVQIGRRRTARRLFENSKKSQKSQNSNFKILVHHFLRVCLLCIVKIFWLDSSKADGGDTFWTLPLWRFRQWHYCSSTTLAGIL